MPVNVLLVDDHTIIRASLHALLEQQADIKVIGEAANGEDAVDLAKQLSPDIVLMDVMLRGSKISGLQATEKIAKSNPKIKIIALSVIEDLSYVKGMLSAGASGYLFKVCSEDELVDAIHTVLADKTYFSEDATQVISEDYVRIVRNKTENRNLTARELETLQLLTSGHPSKSIAVDLNISRKTVDAHKRNIMEKLNLWSIAELTRYAMREGIISDEEGLVH